ncbi:MAG: hypothetical protein AAGC60_25390 [Acidobacteriota bacterium]
MVDRPLPAVNSVSRPLTRILYLVVCVGLGLWQLGCGGKPPRESPAAAAAARQAALGDPPALRQIAGYGYEPRACGFDLDDDGLVGEPADDCRVCDGSTTDPDGDGVDEDLWYVDCDGGVDDRQCGSSERPCASLAYVYSQRADGAANGVEDIVCFRGTCREEMLAPADGGVDGVVTVPAGPLAARDFERAADPALLVGWDGDGDGVYPPFDEDDVAVLDGHGLSRALRLDARADRFELAHFTARGYGMTTDPRGEGAVRDVGFVEFGPSQGTLEHLHFHDLHLVDIARGRAIGSEISTFDLFAGKTRLRWLWVENVWAPRGGGFFARGSGADSVDGAAGGPDAGPLRFERITHTARGCDFARCENGAAVAAFHLWGRLAGIEILDNHFDAGVRDWEPKPKGGPSGARFALIAQCSNDWTLRGNLVVDYKNAFRVQGWAERYCDGSAARPVDDVLIDRNVVRNSYEPWAGGDSMVFVSEGGDSPGEEVGDLVVTNNLFVSPVGAEACFWLLGGSDAAPPDGRIVFAHNTCQLDIDHHGAIVLGYGGSDMRSYPHRRVVVAGNVVTGLGDGDPNVRATVFGERLVLDHNVYVPEGLFVVGDEEARVDQWREATGRDLESTLCSPTFVEVEEGDLRLAAGDTCAAGRMPPLASLFDAEEVAALPLAAAGVDHDGVMRTPGSRAAGAYVAASSRAVESVAESVGDVASGDGDASVPPGEGSSSDEASSDEPVADGSTAEGAAGDGG